MSLKNSWWPELYRPKTIEDYVGEPDFLNKIRTWIEQNDIPHLLFYSEKSGTGKTTVAKLIAENLDADVLYINASKDNNVDTVRDKITNFVMTNGFSKWKILILDEFSYFSVNGQSALNSLMETYSENCRFIITCNYIEKILPSIISRCTVKCIEAPPKTEIMKRMMYILKVENKEYDKTELANIIKEFYPDQRKIISYLQDNTHSGKLLITKDNTIVSDYVDKILDELKSKESVKNVFTNIRQLLADSKIRHYNDMYRYLYDELDEYTKDGQKGLVILAIAEGQYKDSLVVDKEINFMSTIVNILNIIKG